MNNLQSPSQFLASRRSTPPNLLGAPYPNHEQIKSIVQMGLRVPDHKKLEPWRLIFVEGTRITNLANLVTEYVNLYQKNNEKAKKIINLYVNAGAILVLVYSPKKNADTPDWEQFLSVGAVGVSLVNASIIEGFGACWMTGFLPECPEICNYFGIQSHEKIAGLIHIGTAKSVPPERPRPKLDEKLTIL